jgi:hypothetical protein
MTVTVLLTPAAPRAAEVFGLDPDMTGVQLGVDGEVPGPAAGVQDGVGRQLGPEKCRPRFASVRRAPYAVN